MLFYDDLKEKPLNMMNDICDWLSLPSEVYQYYKFTKENRRVLYRYKRLHMFARAVNSSYEKYLRRYPRIKRGIRHIYFLLNESGKRSSTISVVSKETRRYLEQSYEPYNRDLYAFLVNHGQEPSGWLSDFAP